MSKENPMQGWSYEGAEPSVGLTAGGWIHDDCPGGDDADTIEEELAKVAVGDGSARYWTMLTCTACGQQRLVSWLDYDYADDPSYLAWEAEQEAIESGNAMRLVHCYLCFLEETGKSDNSPKQDQGPLRGVEGEKTVYGFNREASARVGFDGDPYAALKLVPCGHVII